METFQLLKTVYGNETVSRICVFKIFFFLRFCEGRENISDDVRSGHLKTTRNTSMTKKV